MKKRTALPALAATMFAAILGAPAFASISPPTATLDLKPAVSYIYAATGIEFKAKSLAVAGSVTSVDNIAGARADFNYIAAAKGLPDPDWKTIVAMTRGVPNDGLVGGISAAKTFGSGQGMVAAVSVDDEILRISASPPNGFANEDLLAAKVICASDVGAA